MDADKSQSNELLEEIRTDNAEGPRKGSRVSRREWFRKAAGGWASLGLASLVDMPTLRASTQELKLSKINEFTTSCNFCSCGCGMVASVRDGKLIVLEGTPGRLPNQSNEAQHRWT